MFSNLLESGGRISDDAHSVEGHALSVALHGVAITLAVLATHHVVAAAARAPTETIAYLAPPPPPPPDVPLPPQEARPATVAPVRGFQLLTAPIDIPDVLPAIDLAQPVTDVADFSGVGKPGGRHDAPPGVAGPAGDATYYASDVGKVAMLVAGAPKPEYPDALRDAGVNGEVHVLFVVDTTGRADLRTLEIMKSTRAEFTAAVRRTLPLMRFLPAESAGRKVRQWVEMPFVFSVR